MISLPSHAAVTAYPLQSFGHLLTVSLEKQIRGISNSLEDLLQESDIIARLESPLEDFLTQHFPAYTEKILSTIDEVIHSKPSRKLLLHPIGDAMHYLCIYLHDAHVYLEWEVQTKASISASEMDEIGFLFEKAPSDIWYFLCRAIRKTIDYDQVVIFQISDVFTGQIVAEQSASGKSRLSGKEFSSDFMTSDILQFYLGKSYRFSQDINKVINIFYSLDESRDLTPCTYVAIPQLHQHYLQSKKITSYIGFPLIIDGRLWGLCIAHNRKEKAIDLQKRKLCTFIVQSAVNKFESQTKQNLLDFYEEIKDIEMDLKGSLLVSKTTNCALAQRMEVLNDMPKADGLALYHNGDIYTYGTCPSAQQVVEIVAFVKAQPKRPLFKDNNFKLKNGSLISGVLPFAGLMALQIGHQDNHFVLWFRKETVNTVTQVRPVNIKPTDVVREVSGHEIWEDTIVGSAIPWDEKDLNFIHWLDKLINEAIIIKASEREKFTEELQSLNNELEMLTFTLSHDLKNPLSMVKMGIQFLIDNESLTADKQRKWQRNLLEGINSIEGIIENVTKNSSTGTYLYAKDPVPMAHMIRTLCKEAKILHNSSHCEIKFGQLFPVWGEKSALYQVFLNVIGNAVKYSASQPLPRIEIHSRKETERVIYTVRDNGIGIPSDCLPTIFDVFYRASNSTGYSGSGIGLGLVKRILDRLGGTIEISSEVSRGTTVSITFPSIGEFPAVIGS